jgi:hypothetical protein
MTQTQKERYDKLGQSVAKALHARHFEAYYCPDIQEACEKLLSLIPVANADNILLISFLASITPAATTVLQFAQIHDHDAEYATAINIFTTVVCIVTMPLFVMLFQAI